MERYEPFLSLLISLAVGLILGLERERSAAADGALGGSFGGARTFPLFALAGSSSMLLAREIGLWFVAVSLAGLFTLVALAYADDLREKRERGLTTEAALLMSFLLGALVMSDRVFSTAGERITVVSSLAVLVTTLLSLKSPLHGLARRISPEDVYSAVKFLIVLVVVLPLLPNEPFGPYGVLNPFHIGTMVVLIAAIGFAGYLLVRVLGPGRGLGLTGLVGGLVSSTAVTLSMSGRAKLEPQVAPSCALAVQLACSVMVVRVLLAVMLVHLPLAYALLWPLLSMLVLSLAASAWAYRRARSTGAAAQAVQFTNPFELSSALKFGALFALILLGAKAASETFGHRGSYLAGVLSGLTDVDAITLSMAQLAKGGLETRVAATTILLAVVSNTVVKAGLSIGAGGWAFGKRVAWGLALGAAGGMLGLVPLWR